jgi:hypothetical protein
METDEQAQDPQALTQTRYSSELGQPDQENNDLKPTKESNEDQKGLPKHQMKKLICNTFEEAAETKTSFPNGQRATRIGESQTQLCQKVQGDENSADDMTDTDS